jgi:hypothetical protein
VLGEDDIRDIRRRFARWKLAQRDSPTALAGCFGLSRQSVYRIASGELYGWVSKGDTLHVHEAVETCESDGNISEEQKCPESTQGKF